MLRFLYSQVLSSPRHGLSVPPFLSLGEIIKPAPSVPVELNPCLCAHACSVPYAPGLAQELPSLCALPLCAPSYRSLKAWAHQSPGHHHKSQVPGGLRAGFRSLLKSAWPYFSLPALGPKACSSSSYFWSATLQGCCANYMPECSLHAWLPGVGDVLKTESCRDD